MTPDSRVVGRGHRGVGSAIRLLVDRSRSSRRRWVRRSAYQHLLRHTGNFSDVRWLGRAVWQNPYDAWALQEVIVEQDIDLVLECGTNRGGSTYFFATIFDLLGRGNVLTVDIESLVDFTHPRIDFFTGSSVAPEIVGRVRRRVVELDPSRVLVLLDSDHSADHVLAELRAYADLVPVGGYVVVQDGIIDELAMFRAGRPGPLVAIEAFLAENAAFARDVQRSDRFVFMHSSSGWLRRTQ